MKLELKHLACYLPYGIKVRVDYYSQHEGRIFIFSPSILLDFSRDEYIVKPILRPLSDLTKEIEHNGDKFVPSKKYNLIQDEDGDWCEEFSAYYSESPIAHVMITSFNWWLFEYHFDVFGLIEKGLAIDINTLCVNK